MFAPRLLSLAAALSLAACSSAGEPTQAQLRESWNEKNVPPAQYKADVIAFMRTYLNDPSNISSAAITRPELKRVPEDPGDRYMVCLRYNARKSGGGYAGSKDVVVTFVSGKFERFIDPQRGDVNPKMAAEIIRDLCKDAAFEPFPELQRLTP